MDGWIRSLAAVLLHRSFASPGMTRKSGFARLDSRGRLSLRDLISRARAPAPHRQKLMNMTEKLRGAMRRMAGVSLVSEKETKRRTLALPSILNTYSTPANIVPKPTATNLRRLGETPVARKAINTIKDRIAGMRWRIQPRQGLSIEGIPDGAERVQILSETCGRPIRKIRSGRWWSRFWRM